MQAQLRKLQDRPGLGVVALRLGTSWMGLSLMYPGGGVALQLGLSQLMGQAAQMAAEQMGMGRNWKLQRLMDAVKVWDLLSRPCS